MLRNIQGSPDSVRNRNSGISDYPTRDRREFPGSSTRRFGSIPRNVPKCRIADDAESGQRIRTSQNRAKLLRIPIRYLSPVWRFGRSWSTSRIDRRMTKREPVRSGKEMPNRSLVDRNGHFDAPAHWHGQIGIGKKRTWHSDSFRMTMNAVGTFGIPRLHGPGPYLIRTHIDGGFPWMVRP